MPSLQNGDYYSSTVGVIFLFNLIVGTGALALPGALQRAGWIIGVFLLILLGLVSFITVTFIVESLAVANAVSRKRYGEQNGTQGDRQRLLPSPPGNGSDVFEITEKYEIGQMGVLMSPKWCQVVVYASMCIYLFGDLSIYAVVFGKTFSKILCTDSSTNQTNATITDNAPCRGSSGLSVINVYRLSITCFIILVGPFVFFNLQKTKVLQIITGAMRWLAFFIMITWSIHDLIRNGRQGYPPMIEPRFLPALFGTSVYSFMCQHSIPGLLFPIKNKESLKFIIPLDYSLITIFYLMLCLTAVFTYKTIGDIYTLNFWDETSGPNSSIFLRVLAYYLALFPIFTIGTNYPLLAITLRNNFRAMVLKDAPKKWYYDQFLFPLITILPPTALALGVSDLHMLFGIIGSYCGTCIQYLVPCLLVTFARYQAESFDSNNKFASPFKSKVWIYAVYVWMAISLVCITLNYLSAYF